MIQIERSGTLGCSNDQTVFCLQGAVVGRADTAGPGGKGYRADGMAYTVDTKAPSIVCISEQPTVCLNDQGGGVMSVSCDITGTLRAEEHGHPPLVMQQLYKTHPQDSRVTGPCDVADTVTSYYGTGGGNTPLVLAFKPKQGADSRSIGVQAEQSPTLGAEMGTPAVLTGVLTPGESQARRIYGDAGVYTSLAAREKSGQEQAAVFSAALVRRLIPLECERLQGYPDNWTLLEPIEALAEEEYDFWCGVLFDKARREGMVRLNSQGTWEVWRYVTPDSKSFDPTREADQNGGYWENTRKPYRHKTRTQMVRWYNKSFCEDADSARYRAIGNSIALPSWGWVLARLSLCASAEPTMASLFDGIGGFPLIWEGLNGKGSCLWASEIEAFPIAVTLARIGDGVDPPGSRQDADPPAVVNDPAPVAFQQERYDRYGVSEIAATLKARGGSYGGGRKS